MRQNNTSPVASFDKFNLMPVEKVKIVRLERLWNDDRPVCDHAFSLIMDGRMVQDDPSCPCGGQRLTLIAVSCSDAQQQVIQ